MRVGVFLPRGQISLWLAGFLRDLEISGHSELAVLLRVDVEPRDLGFSLAAAQKSHGVVDRMLGGLERRLYQPDPDAFEAAAQLDFLSDVSELSLRGRWWESATDRDTVSRLALDVIIDGGVGPIDDKCLSLARCGVWTCDRPYVWGAGGGREVLFRREETAVSVWCLRAGEGPDRLLKRVYLGTDRMSVRRNRSRYWWRAACLLLRCLRSLREMGAKEFFGRALHLEQEDVWYSLPAGQAVGSTELVRKVAGIYGWKLRSLLGRLRHREQWVLYFHCEDESFPWRPLHRLRGIVPPKDRFWADPHVVFREGRYFVFIEELIYREGVGHISVMELEPSGRYTGPRVVLKTDHHLSYPFVFEHEGDCYMIPETAAKRRIELYRCQSFPDEWALETVLIDDVSAVDATLVQRDGKWWLFANLQVHQGSSALDELFLFHSEELTQGNWTPHPANPVVSDVRRARPAGRFIELNGTLYRPSQKGTPRYGYGVVINEVLSLTEETYEEREVCLVEPLWDPDLVATHSISSGGGMTVFDGRLKRPR